MLQLHCSFTPELCLENLKIMHWQGQDFNLYWIPFFIRWGTLWHIEVWRGKSGDDRKFCLEAKLPCLLIISKSMGYILCSGIRISWFRNRQPHKKVFCGFKLLGNTANLSPGESKPCNSAFRKKSKTYAGIEQNKTKQITQPIKLLYSLSPGFLFLFVSVDIRKFGQRKIRKKAEK